MNSKYDKVVANRRSRMSKEARAQAGVFAKAYDIAMQVIELREKQGITQKELAVLCDMDQGDISRIESGVTSPTARTLQKIANVLNADLRLIKRRAS